MAKRKVKKEVTVIGLYGGETPKSYSVWFPHGYGHLGNQQYVPKSQVSAITGTVSDVYYDMLDEGAVTKEQKFYEVEVTIPYWLYRNYLSISMGKNLTDMLPEYTESHKRTYYGDDFFQAILPKLSRSRPPRLNNNSENESERVPTVEKATSGKVYGVFLKKINMDKNSLLYYINDDYRRRELASPNLKIDANRNIINTSGKNVEGIHFQMLFHNGRGHMQSLFVSTKEINSIKRVYPKLISVVDTFTTARERARGNSFNVVVLELDVPVKTRSNIYNYAPASLQMEKSLPNSEWNWKEIFKRHGKTPFNKNNKDYGKQRVPTKTARNKMSLRNKLIRLAYEQPQLRGDLLPLIKSAGNKSIGFALSFSPLDMVEEEQEIKKIIRRNFKGSMSDYNYFVATSVGDVPVLYISDSRGNGVKGSAFRIDWRDTLKALMKAKYLSQPNFQKGISQALRQKALIPGA